MCFAGGSSRSVLCVLVIADRELATQTRCASRAQAGMCQSSAYVVSLQRKHVVQAEPRLECVRAALMWPVHGDGQNGK